MPDYQLLYPDQPEFSTRHLSAVSRYVVPLEQETTTGVWRWAVNITYHCLECDWEGKLPSWSDTSETRENAYGVLEYTHHHVPVCPECHKAKMFTSKLLPEESGR